MKVDARARRGARLRVGVRLSVAVLLMGFLSAACGPEFDPYSTVKDLRVMAIRADQPSLAPSGVVTFEALTFEDSEVPLSYSWSWCPLSAGAADAYECAIPEEDFRGFADQAGFTIPPYDLGDTPQVTFAYPDPPELIAFLCEEISGEDLPDFFSAPDCSRGLDVLIRLDVSDGAQTLTAVRTLELLVNDQVPANNNPELISLSVALEGEPREAATSLEAGAEPITLERDKRYTLYAEVPESSSESFVSFVEGEGESQQDERLILSWFVGGGSLDDERTGFIPGEVSLAEADNNVWKTPTIEDFGDPLVKVFVVLRDGRGGVDWVERTVRLER